jgi:hypothetical protein
MKNLFTFFLIISFGLFKSQTPTYKLLRNNADTKFVVGNLALVNLTLSGSRMSMAGGPGVKFYMNGLYVTADYEFHYLDGIAEALKSNSNSGYSVYKNQNSRNAEATVGYFFRKKAVKAVKVFLYNERSGSVVTNYYANIDATINKIFGMQLGYKSGFTNIAIPDGVTIKPYEDVNAPAQSSSFNMSTFMQYGWISFGPSYGKVEDVVADIEGYGIKKAQFFSRFYANILIATKTKLEDVYHEIDNQTGTGNNGTLVYRYVLDGNIKMSNFGFNIGYETFKFNKFGLSNKFEVGLMPGVKSNIVGNLYASVKIGLSFGKCFPK